MKILMVAPLPPPVSGNSLPVKVLYNSLSVIYDVKVVNLSKPKHGSGQFDIGRVVDILRHIFRVWDLQTNSDVVYLTIAESFLGNLRDIIFYLACHTRLDSVYVHMFGGAGMRKILSRRKGVQYRLNKYFLGRVNGIIVEGETQAQMFAAVANPKIIHVVNNFAEDFLFITEEEVVRKFSNTIPLRLLFLSNMLWGKGHNELLEAYSRLSQTIQDNMVIDFAGKFPDEKEQAVFVNRIRELKNINFLGPVYKLEKKKKFSQAHVFCLPTYYPYEGQPFSIIEAYAAGCVVITTKHSGIGDIFQASVNGYEVEKQSVSSLQKALEKLFFRKNKIVNIALKNLKTAQAKYTQTQFVESMQKIMC